MWVLRRERCRLGVVGAGWAQGPGAGLPPRKELLLLLAQSHLCAVCQPPPSETHSVPGQCLLPRNEVLDRMGTLRSTHKEGFLALNHLQMLPGITGYHNHWNHRQWGSPSCNGPVPPAWPGLLESQTSFTGLWGRRAIALHYVLPFLSFRQVTSGHPRNACRG